uniref:DNA/RNA non-specific endonuclease n=1 Tax=Streptomyces sp. NBC_01393 TaxID=2903851 RepID=A0AAU3I9R5_9ACTN
MVDLNPLHYINKFNHMFGDSVADGLEFLGISDPAVDPDGIREIAKKWRGLAKGLEGAAAAAERALSGMKWEGKAAEALHERSKSARRSANDMAHSLRAGAKALDDFADNAHELLSEIGVMLAEIAEFEIAGLALSVLTAGASEVASTLMAGERALKVVALVGRIEEEGTALGSVVRGVMEVIRGIERALKALKEIRGVAAAGKMAMDGVKFSAFETLLKDPSAFKDPDKLTGILTEGALMGVGMGVLGKALGKGLKALKPSELAGLAKALKLGENGLSKLRLRPGEAERLEAGIQAAEKECKLDPVDVATGDMLLPQTDVELPGILPLMVQRTHVSSYRWGGWFGPSWASTLDQRLQADDVCITYAAPDGSRLVYPLLDAAADGPVLPETGPRRPLSWDTEVDGAVRILDPVTGLSYVFHSPGPADDGNAVEMPLQFITDRNGHRISIKYTAEGTPVEITHSGGYRVAIDRHHELPRIAALRLLDPGDDDRRGTTLISYGYSADGHLTEVTNSSALPLRFTYDTEGRITSWTDRNNTSYSYTYDHRGRVARTEGSGDYLSGTLTYDDATRTTTTTDALGHVTRYEHNEAFRLVRTIDPLGHATCQEWDAQHRLVAVTDPLGHTTRYTYDDMGCLSVVLRPDGSRLRSEHNELRLPTKVTEPDGAVWRYAYDVRGNRTAVIDPSGQATRYTIGRDGAVKEVMDPLGERVEIVSNAAGLPLVVTGSSGTLRQVEYDAFGRPVLVIGPGGEATRLTWSVEGQLTSRSNPDGSTETWVFDGEGNCTLHSDPLGATVSSDFAAFDLLTARVDPGGTRHTFTYDTARRLTAVTNPQGLTWAYRYDSAGQLVEETDFDDRKATYEYDDAGRLVRRVNSAGQTVAYRYNSLGQLIEKAVDGRPTRFENDPCGRLLRAVGPEATLEYRYDAVGRVVAESVDGRVLTTSCDAAGRRTRRITPSGATTAYSYDPVGNYEALTISGRTLSFRHDAAGRETQRNLRDRFTLDFAWNDQGRLAGQTLTTPDRGQPRIERTYAYRGDGHLTSVTDQHGRRSFTLDAAGRVTGVQAADWTETYAYDEAGNQAHASWPDRHPGGRSRGPRSYTGTRLTRAGGTRYAYDEAGRTTMRQKTRLSRKPDTWRYTWDAEDHLTSVTTPDGTRWRYVYDPLGRRTAKQRLTADGTVAEETRFTWDGSTLTEQVTHVVGATELITLTWDHDGLAPLAQTETRSPASAPQEVIDQRFFAIVTDQIGTPTELLDEDGNTAWRTRATLWGATTWNRDAAAYTPLRFPGQYYDPETGLHHNYFRYYDPETARFLTLDPLGLDSAPNPVAYVDNPHTLCDPLGLAPCDEADVTWGGRVQYGALGPHDRATSMYATIVRDMLGGKTKAQVDPAGWEAGKGYNRAHLLAAMIGGSNKDARNFVTMHSYANSPVMRQIELQVRNAVRDTGETIQYSVKPIYADEHAKIPLGVTIEAHGNKGFQMHPHGSTGGGTNVFTIWNRKR